MQALALALKHITIQSLYMYVMRSAYMEANATTSKIKAGVTQTISNQKSNEQQNLTQTTAAAQETKTNA